ncbi:hypothetical protein E2C01_047497 [Portunus trituberculatus]|uniref:Uncharacterized protein n=1 Tax=Portunus trituberculatus TaxID=210409 RepID=A0A5B7G815_PORTR|nr:hypothetical protein [Portunus trituberculatus]
MTQYTNTSPVTQRYYYQVLSYASVVPLSLHFTPLLPRLAVIPQPPHRVTRFDCRLGFLTRGNGFLADGL